MGTMDKKASQAMDRALFVLAVVMIVALALFGLAAWKLMELVASLVVGTS